MTDTAFIRQAARGNALEVQLSRLAGSRAEDSAVADFAERRVREHGAMRQPWATLARNNRVTLDTGLDSAEEQEVERLERLSGDAFDRAYMASMIRHHEQDWAVLRRASTAARDRNDRYGQAVGEGRDDQNDRDDRGELRGADRAFLAEVPPGAREPRRLRPGRRRHGGLGRFLP